jgi:hypothetical protein
MPISLHSITVDARHSMSLARFWAEALGWTIPPHRPEDLEWLKGIGIDDPEDDPYIPVRPPDGGPQILFCQVPEAKAGKNRVHLDVRASTTMREEVDRLVGLGATVVREMSETVGVWTVMQDPEGNEFCVERSDAERETPA